MSCRQGATVIGTFSGGSSNSLISAKHAPTPSINAKPVGFRRCLSGSAWPELPFLQWTIRGRPSRPWRRLVRARATPQSQLRQSHGGRDVFFPACSTPAGSGRLARHRRTVSPPRRQLARQCRHRRTKQQGAGSLVETWTEAGLVRASATRRWCGHLCSQACSGDSGVRPQGG